MKAARTWSHRITRQPLAWGLKIVAAVTMVLLPAHADSLCEWEEATALPHPVSPRKAVWGNDQFVAVDGSGKGLLLRSPDGDVWTRQTVAATASLAGIAYGKATYVAVGGRSIITSPDGVMWSRQTLAETNAVLAAVAFAQDQFVAVGRLTVDDSGSVLSLILASPNGQTWQLRDAGTSFGLNGLTFGNGVFVAVGERGHALISPDGATWKPSNGIAGADYLAGVAFGNGTFVAVGAAGGSCSGSGTALYSTSTDGMTWSGPRGGGWPFSGSCSFDGVTFGAGHFVAVGNYAARGGLHGSVVSSQDGQNWVGVAGKQTTFFGVAYGNNRFLALGEETVLRSGDLSAPPKPPRFLTSGPLWLDSDGMHLTLAAPSGAVLVIQFSTDLAKWDLLKTVTNLACATEVLDPDASRSSSRFYRATQTGP